MSTPSVPLSEEDIYRTIKNVILSAQLPAGTRLPEARLAPLFGVTRERLRKVLHRLGHESTLEIVPNIGVRVPTQSMEKARELFEARRILESGICMRLSERITDEELSIMHAHLAMERQVAETGPRADFIYASSQFHLLLASFLNSPLVTAQLEFLLSKSALFSAYHDPRNVSMCSCHEHMLILDALKLRDIYAAHHATVSHLSLIETRLQLQPVKVRKIDLEEIFKNVLNISN